MQQERTSEMTRFSEKSATIVEVGARDGLQNEPEVFSTETKVALLTRMMEAGARRLEVASFVHPKLVPQMADAEAVVASLPDRKDVSYIGLVLNKRGLMRALATREGNRRGVDEAGCVATGSDSFGQRNQGQSLEDAICESRDMLRLARQEGLVPQVTVSVAFGCPFAPRATGNIATEDLLYLLHRSGAVTGIDLEATIETARWFEGIRGKPAASMLAKAGPFPASA